MADERWLTYRQAGDLLRITPEAARHRSRRFHWPTRKDQLGKALIQVPLDEAARTGTDQPLNARLENGFVLDDTRMVKDATRGHFERPLNELTNLLKDQLAKAEAAREQDREAHRAELARVEAMLAKAEMAAKAERERHAGEIAWHRAELERLNTLLARPWWRRIVG